MKRKLVFRYYCEFCRKANCSAPSMTKHERACTANPNRICGMCKVTEHPQAELADIIDALQHDVEATAGDGIMGKVVKPSLAWTVADFCPACLLAAIRQIKPNDALHYEWDFKAAAKEFWQNYNEQIA